MAKIEQDFSTLVKSWGYWIVITLLVGVVCFIGGKWSGKKSAFEDVRVANVELNEQLRKSIEAIEIPEIQTNPVSEECGDAINDYIRDSQSIFDGLR